MNFGQKSSALCGLIFLSMVTISWSYTQEIILYDNLDQTGTSWVRQEHVPDTSFVGGVVRSFCTRGFWIAYTEPNYGGLSINYHGNDNNLSCIPGTAQDYKSFRYGGAPDADDVAISIYPEPAYHGPELLLTNTTSAFGLNGKSLLYSGRSSWTLYEGQNFTGRFCCVGTSSAYIGLGVDGEFNVETALKLPQVGSILSGCPTTVVRGSRVGQRSYSTCYDEETNN